MSKKVHWGPVINSEEDDDFDFPMPKERAKFIAPGRNDACWCNSGRKYKACHLRFDDRLKAYADKGFSVPDHEVIKTPEMIEGMKKSAEINMACLDYVGEHIKAGITTQQIDDWVSEITLKMGGHCATLGYEGYPKSVCTSINNVVCHGIPSEDVVLKDGDIVNVDCTTYYEGYYADSSRMYMIGQVSDKAKKLVEDVKKSVEIGLENIKPWAPLGDMCDKINSFLKEQGYGLVEEIGGHGIGRDFHEDPFVCYIEKPGQGMLMAPGLCFTIEPMVNCGTHEFYVDEDDDWTVYTADDELSAQWEVQVVVTEDGYELICW